MLQINLLRSIQIILVALVVAVGFIACKKTVPDPVSALSLSDFEARLDNLQKGSKIPGMAAGIVKDGNVIWANSYGSAVMQNKPVSNSTIFHLASLTKTFAAVVIMQLVNENK